MAKAVAGNAVALAAADAPLGEAMQGLSSLVQLMRNLSPQGGATLNPKLILTGSGLELRFSDAESTDAAESLDRLASVERELGLLGARIGRMESTAKLDESLAQTVRRLEEQVGSQSAVIDSLRAAVQHNEEMMETLADSISMMDELAIGQPELVFGAETLAS